MDRKKEILTKDQALEQLIGVAAEVFQVSPAKITGDLKVGMIEAWDSFGHLMLFMAIEEKMKVKFCTEEIVSLSSLEEIAQKIAGRK